MSRRRSIALSLSAVAALALALAATPADAAKKKKKPKKPATTEQPAEKPEEEQPPPDPPAAEEEAAPQPPPPPPPAASTPKAAKAPTPEAEAEAAAAEIDVDALRKEYEQVKEKLFRSRATSAAVGDALYSARLRIHLRFGGSSRFWALKRVTIRLDGANVYDDDAGAIAGDDAPRFETFVAPGKHTVTIRIEAQSKDDERITTVTETTLVVDAPEKKLTLVKAKADDDGDIGWSWKKKNRGSYKLRLDVGVEAKELKDDDAAQ